jgi:hypothetical protein
LPRSLAVPSQVDLDDRVVSRALPLTRSTHVEFHSSKFIAAEGNCAMTQVHFARVEYKERPIAGL